MLEVYTESKIESMHLCALVSNEICYVLLGNMCLKDIKSLIDLSSLQIVYF